MKEIYISGALTNVSNPDETKKFYEEIGQLCIRFGNHPYVPHLHTDPIKNADVTPDEVYKTDKSKVVTSDLLIAYIGIPSLGVGMELAYAEERNIPIILMYEKNKPISRFPRGIPAVIKEISFSNFSEGLSLLEEFITVLAK
jgi:hypothetical protein